MLSKSKKASKPDSLQALIVDAVQDIKGQDIVLMDLTKVKDASADYFIVCHANSVVQVNGIIENVRRRVAEEWGERPVSSEGQQSRQWMVLDYFSVVLHVFTKDRRPFYNLEGLWSDAKCTKYENLS